MARRTVLTGRQRSALFSLPQHEADLLRHYTLSDEDLQHIEARRRPRNKLGFALQLCVRRLSGFAPTRWSTPNAGSKPASPNAFRPDFAGDLRICSARRSTPT